jgi:hypothetical protein
MSVCPTYPNPLGAGSARATKVAPADVRLAAAVDTISITPLTLAETGETHVSEAEFQTVPDI